jgi:hypothetical protein
MSDLVNQIVDKLSSQDAEELRYIAGKALGDIVKKLVWTGFHEKIFVLICSVYVACRAIVSYQ